MKSLDDMMKIGKVVTSVRERAYKAGWKAGQDVLLDYLVMKANEINDFCSEDQLVATMRGFKEYERTRAHSIQSKDNSGN